MSALWWLLPLALAACLAVVAIAARLSPKPRHAAPRRHLEVVRDGRGQVDGYGSMILNEERAYRADGPSLVELDAYGDYGPQEADRLAGLLRDELLDWRAQTAADLSPEALNDQPDPYLDALTAEHGSEYEPGWYYCGECGKAHLPEDSGPGAPSSGSDTPGPDQPFDLREAILEAAEAGGGVVQIPPGTYGPYFATTEAGQAAWLDGQLAVLYAWVRDQYAAAAA